MGLKGKKVESKGLPTNEDKKEMMQGALLELGWAGGDNDDNDNPQKEGLNDPAGTPQKKAVREILYKKE